MKYNRPGGTVEIRWRAVGADSFVDVVDTGYGIPEQDRDRLFRQFERLGAETTDVEGTGLGLASSFRLVDAMGGTMSVRSSELGTTFTVRLASAPAAEGSHLTGWVDGRLMKTGLRVLDKQTLVYIEDNLSNLRLVERALAKRPNTVVIPAMQGSMGIDLARQQQPRLVLLDLNLPDLHGLEVLRLLKADPLTASIPVVIITADAMSGAGQQAKNAGAVEVLFKPIDVKRLLDIVDAVVTPSGIR